MGGVDMQATKLGVLGGMGPAATALFFNKVINNTVARSDQEHIDMLISNHATLPDRTEAILKNKEHLFLQAIQEDFHLFEQANVKNIAIPCNTSHYFYKEMQEMTDVHIINMVQSTIETIVTLFGKGSKVAILATDGTIKSKVYENECHKHHIVPHIPNDTTQQKIMDLIYKVKAGKHVDPRELEHIIEYKLHQEGCTAIILGCTELSCIPLKKEIKEHCIDPLEILVHTSICLSGKKSKLSHLHNDLLTKFAST